MKVLKKIGLGIISLGLISTFYIPEAKANLTLFEFEYPSYVPVLGGRTYAIKRVTPFNLNSGKYLIKRVGSGNKDCQMWISSVSTLAAFTSCVEEKLGNDMMTPLIISAIRPYL